MTTFTIKDALAATHNFATQIISSLETAGVWLRAVPEGGATAYRNINLGTTGQVVKAAAGSLYCLDMTNLDNVVVFVKLYNKATAPSGSDTPVMTFPVGPGFRAVNFLPPLAFATGISIRVSTGLADNDANAPNANTVIVNLTYA